VSRSLHVLLVEDAEDDALLIARVLLGAGWEPDLLRVDSAEAFRAALARSKWDVVIADYSVPGFDAPRALELLQQSGLDLPFLIVSGTVGEEAAVAAMKAGAHDYLHKSRLGRLGPAVARELREVAHRLARREAEQRLLAERLHAEQERERLLAQEQAARAQAEQAVQARDAFLSIASHELRTPLNSLQLGVQSLLRISRQGGSAPPAVLAAVLDTVDRQTRRMARLVDTLLDLARIDSGRLDLAPRPVDLAATVREVAACFRPDLEQARCALNLRADNPVVGVWDPARLEQVVNNLLSNAVRYGAGLPIEIAVVADGGRARLTVTDHGIGIPPSERARIFERFERAVSARHYGGLGLGLFIVRQVLDAMGGSVRVESEPGRGSAFTVELPLAPDGSPLRTARPERRTGRPAEPTGPTRSCPPGSSRS
jgi:signal transduction histidine kinase